MLKIIAASFGLIFATIGYAYSQTQTTIEMFIFNVANYTDINTTFKIDTHRQNGKYGGINTLVYGDYLGYGENNIQTGAKLATIWISSAQGDESFDIHLPDEIVTETLYFDLKINLPDNSKYSIDKKPCHFNGPDRTSADCNVFIRNKR